MGKWMAVLALGGALAGCSGGSSAADGGDDGDSVDISTEAPDLSEVGGSATHVEQAKGVAGIFVLEDPTIDPSQSAAQNAQKVQQQASTGLGASCPTGSVTLDVATSTVAIDFGSNCSIGNLGEISGSASAAVSQPSAGTIQVLFTFTSLSVSGHLLNGTLTAATSNGTSYTASASLQTGTRMLSLTTLNLTLDSDGAGLTIAGSGTVTPTGGAAEQASFSGVHHVFGACYADAGTIALTKTTTTRSGKSVNITETITFQSSTPTTGQVQVQLGTAPATTVKLPGYGSCGAGDGGD